MYRYERKFRLMSQYYHNIKNQIELGGWFKLYKPRKINNIYFDDLDNTSYDDSINGHLNKKKYRIRWYGNTFFNNNQMIKDPKFEIKIKRDMLNYKKTFDLDNFFLASDSSFITICNMVKTNIKNKIPSSDYIDIEMKEPRFINSYEREYYIDRTNNFRITIDKHQKYYSINPSISSAIQERTIVIELKFSSQKSYKNFVVRTNLIQNSKFSTGIVKLY